MLKLVGVALIALPLASSIVLAEDLKLPPLQKQSTPQAVIDEHFDALNKCDWNRIMAQYPADYQLNLPEGVVVKGREEAGNSSQASSSRTIREVYAASSLRLSRLWSSVKL